MLPGGILDIAYMTHLVLDLGDEPRDECDGLIVCDDGPDGELLGVVRGCRRYVVEKDSKPVVGLDSVVDLWCFRCHGSRG